MRVSIHSLSHKNVTFWSFGNKPTQVLYGLSASEIQSHLKALYLLSDRVIAAASFFFESAITAQTTKELAPLFQEGEIAFFIDEDIESFSEHGLRKREKSPYSLSCYRDERIVLTKGADLDALGHVITRPAHSLSDRIVQLWKEDICDTRSGKLGYHLREMCTSAEDYARLIVTLSSLAESRRKDFVWEYISPLLKKLGLPAPVLRVARARLAHLYTLATVELLGVNLDDPLAFLTTNKITIDARYDSGLFLRTMAQLGVQDQFRSLRAEDLCRLKRSSQWRIFKRFYISLIEAAHYIPDKVADWLPILKGAAIRYPASGLTRFKFVELFGHMSLGGGGKGRQFAESLDILLSAYEVFNKSPIDDFVKYVAMTRGGMNSETLNVGDKRMKTTVLFLAANPDDQAKLDLDEEMRAIDRAIRGGEYRESFVICPHGAVRVNELQDIHLRHRPGIVHFAGHGSPRSEIVLKNESGLSQSVSPQALSQLYDILGNEIKCVVLNACYSEGQAAAIATHIDVVIGMRGGIDDKSAIRFSEGFYRALAYGKSVQTAFHLGCNQINLEALGDEYAPQLKVKEGADPSNIRFV